MSSAVSLVTQQLLLACRLIVQQPHLYADHAAGTNFATRGNFNSHKACRHEVFEVQCSKSCGDKKIYRKQNLGQDPILITIILIGW